MRGTSAGTFSGDPPACHLTSRFGPILNGSSCSCGRGPISGPLGRLAGAGTGLFRCGVHRFVYWIEIVGGWIFVSLFIAGMSGIMKKE
jgi:hypothetical protein